MRMRSCKSFEDIWRAIDSKTTEAKELCCSYGMFEGMGREL